MRFANFMWREESADTGWFESSWFIWVRIWPLWPDWVHANVLNGKWNKALQNTINDWMDYGASPIIKAIFYEGPVKLTFGWFKYLTYLVIGWASISTESVFSHEDRILKRRLDIQMLLSLRNVSPSLVILPSNRMDAGWMNWHFSN